MRFEIPNTPGNPLIGFIYAAGFMTIGILCAIVACELWPLTGFGK